MGDDIEDRTIRDFGEQWTAFRDNDGWYGSSDFLVELLEPVVDPAIVQGARCAEVGSGSGRIVAMLLELGASHVTAVEPSAAVDVLRDRHGDDPRVEIVHGRGTDLPLGDYDVVLAIGVLHHIPDPAPTVARMRAATRRGGTACVWLYGREGNGPYLAVARPLRALTRRLPHRALNAVAATLELALRPYARACRRFALPGGRYVVHVLSRLEVEQRRLMLYDQLNPGYARYYRGADARRLLEDAGFVHVRLDHRHGYSWVVAGAAPGDEDGH